MANSWENLILAWEPQLRAAFSQAVYNLRNQADIDHLTAMLEQGDVDGALRAVGLDPVAFRVFDKTFGNAFEAGGNATALSLPVSRAADGLRLTFQFAVRNPTAENWLKTYSSQLVTEILDDQRAMIRNVLTDGLAQGLNPRTSALDLVGRIGSSGKREGGMIGLTDSQSQWVQNYADELASDNPEVALERLLRDKRFDKTVLKAAREGRTLTQSEIAPMVRAYKNRALRYRAETIARKETITALHTAQEQAINQAIDKGAINGRDVQYVWHTAHDSRVRETHQTMDGQVRKLGQTFTTGSGASLRYPGDPSGPAAEVINCRCFREPKIDFLAGIR